MADLVTRSLDGNVAVIRLDDGKANAISHEVIERLHESLDFAERDAHAVCLIGREGKLSAGFDLSVMMAGPDQARGLVRAGGELLMRIYGHPQPVVVAVTGHALAAGALVLLACDSRIGMPGPFKIGLNETAIGMGLPAYAVELARDRLSKRHLTRSALQAEIHDPERAVDAGFLDRVVEPGGLEDAALAEARELGSYRSGAYRMTKALLRQPTIDRVLATLDDDMAAILPDA